MSDFRLRRYIKNSTASQQEEEKPIIKQANFAPFPEETDSSPLYKENQENMLKGWIEKRLSSQENIKEETKEGEVKSSSHPSSLLNSGISPNLWLKEKDRAEKTGKYYQAPNLEGSGGFLRSGDFSQLQKVSKFLMTLPKEEVASILKYLDEKEKEAILRQMVRTPAIKNPVEIYEIQKEFKDLFQKVKNNPQGGTSVAKRMLEISLGEEKAEEVLQKVERRNQTPFSFLKEVESLDLWDALKGESIATLAVVFNFLDKKQAKYILEKLENKEKKDLLIRLARMEKVHEEILNSIESKIKEKVENKNNSSQERVEGKAILANILQHMDPSVEERLVDSLNLKEKEKDKLEDLLFNIEVVLRIEDEDLHKVLKDYSSTEIALLIRAKDLEVKHKILSNLSKRRQIDVEEEGYALGKVHMREVDLITRRFLEDLQKRQEEDDIIIYRKNEEFIE